MDSGELDKKIAFAEKRVLLNQSRIIEYKEKANIHVKRLERDARNLEEIKKEWIRKKNLEEERVRLERSELAAVHRHAIEDLRLKYEKERDNKLREVKREIAEEEKELREWQKKRAEATLITKAEEAKIKARFQVKINELLREEQSSCRRGVVRRKRLLDAPNVFSMSLEKDQPSGMKKRPYQRRFV